MGNVQMQDGRIVGDGEVDTTASSPDSGGGSFIGLSNIRRPSWIRTSWSMALRRSRSSGSTTEGTSPRTSPTTDTAVQTPVTVPPDFGTRVSNTIAEYTQSAGRGNGLNQNNPFSMRSPTGAGPTLEETLLATDTDNSYLPMPLSTGLNVSHGFPGLPMSLPGPLATDPDQPAALCRPNFGNPDLLRLTHIVPDDEFHPDSPLIDSGEGSSSSSLESLRLDTDYVLGRDGLDEGGSHTVSPSLALLLRAALKTLRKESDCREEKLATLQKVKELVVDKEEQREKISDDMVSLGYPEVYSKLVQRYVEDEGPNGASADEGAEGESPMKTRWKILEIIYLTCVKISDKSAAFGKALTDAGLLKTTTDTLNREDYKNKCTGEFYCDTTSWMLELVGNCYDDIARDDDLRNVCKRTVEWYLECGNESLRLKAGQTMLMMLLKDRVEDRLQVMAAAVTSAEGAGGAPPGGVMSAGGDLLEPTFSPYTATTTDDTTTGLSGSEDVAEALAQELIRRMLGGGPGGGGPGSTADDVLDDFMDAMSPEKRKVREAEHMAEIGMHTVYVQNIRRWLKDPSRWLAFNEDGKMWGCVHEWFSRVSLLSRASDRFSTAVCEAGMVAVLAEILTTEQIHEAHARNNKVKEVIASALAILLSVTKLRAASKWLRGVKVKESVKRYALSKDINIKGLAVLVLANLDSVTLLSGRLTEEDDDESNVGLDFTTEDIDLLLATYLAYKTEGEAMGAFLARTNFPELCVQELRHHISANEVFQDETWERVHRLMAAMHLFSNKSSEFAAALCQEDIVTPLRAAIASPRLRARIEDETLYKEKTFAGWNVKMLVYWLENSRRMLHACLSLVHHCVRLDFKDKFLVPSLWDNIHFYATLSDPENPLRWAAFLAFSHIHAYVTHQPPANGLSHSASCDPADSAHLLTSSRPSSLIGPSTSSDALSYSAASAESRNAAILISQQQQTTVSATASPGRTKNKKVVVNKFPSLRETHDDVKFLNKLWHTTNEQEEPVLGDFIAATGGAEIHTGLMEQMVAHLPVITSAANIEKVKMLLANMNNLAIESESFSTRLCAAERSVLKSLVAIVLSPYIDLGALNSQEELVLDHTLSAISACSKYKANVHSFRLARAPDAICRFLSSSSVDDSLRRRAWSTLIHLHHHDKSVVHPHLADLILTTTDAREQKFYYKLYQTGRADRVQNMIADFLIDLKAPEMMASKLKELVLGKTLFSDWDLSKHLLHNMWNYSDVSEAFTNHFRDAGVFETLQDVLRDLTIRSNIEHDEKCQDALRASINILFNCSQYDSNRQAMTSLRLVNDLLQFSKGDTTENQHIKTSAVLTTAFLVSEDNAHLIRADSRSGVIRFILEKLEDTLFSKTHRSGGFSTQELLKSLCRVAMNDANKVILVYDGILPLLSPLLEGGTCEEKQWACRILWRLAFVEDNKRAIRDEERLMGALEAARGADLEGLRALAQGAMFELEKSQDRINRALERQVRSPARRGPREYQSKVDIYLSHHPDRRDFFDQLRAALQQEGFRVASSHSSSSPQTLQLPGGGGGGNPVALMAETMERSRIFLVELSQAYQHSELCRSEAEYARDLLKPVVPVRLERPFKASGWLSRLVAGRVYVDFSRSPPGSNDFEDRVDELGREVRLVLNSIHRKEHVE